MATGVIPDTQAPTAPSSLTATAISGTEIDLNWTASTDNVGVTGYLVERCQGASCTTFAQIGTSTGTTYPDTALSASTPYSYRVRATDAAGNLSPYSSTAATTTLSANSGLVAAYSFDEGTGTTVTDLSNTGNTGTIANTTWTSTGKYGKALVFNGTSSWVAIPDAPSLDLTTSETLEAWVYPVAIPPSGCSPSATCSWMDVIYKDTDRYYVEASSNQNQEPEAGGIFADGKHIVFGPSVLPLNAWTHLALTYDSTTLKLYVNGALVASLPETGLITTSTNPLFIGGDQTMGQFFNGMIDEVRVYNIALNQAQIQADMNTPLGYVSADKQSPTAPSNLTATAISGSQINLSWTASTDNVGVTGYLVERCQGTACTSFAQIATPTAATYSDLALTAGASYSYRVRATDAAGNLSPYSNVSSATTQISDTQPPTTPTNLTATAISGSQVNLSWTASTDNVGVTGYLIERCQGAGCSNWARLLTVPGTTYSDSGLLPNTSYSYHVKATDAAGNFSAYSSVATTTTLATIPGLVAAYSFDEGSGTTVSDSSGNGNNGTVTNTTWTSTAKYGNALQFNGSNARVSIPDSASLHLTTAMTLEAWVNPSSVTNAWTDLIYKGNDNYFLEATSDRGSVPAGGGTFGSTGGLVIGAAKLAANTWSHVALTYDGATLALYLNGIQVSSQPQTGTLLTSTNPLQIGGDSIYGQYFSGTIDEVRIYNTALNQAQVQADMGTPIGAGGSLPAVNLSSTSLAFGNMQTGLPVRATGDDDECWIGNLAINSIVVSGANAGDFAQTNNCGAALSANTNCTINVTFTPTNTGSRFATVSISDNAPTSPQAVSLSGTGTGFAVSPRVVDLTFTRTQQFTATGGTVTWSVDGVPGGSTTSGTITSTGLYTPPLVVSTHTVTASTTSPPQSASATVYITNYAGTFTHHNDNFRTGLNSNESVLTPANVNQTQFGKLSRPL